MWQTRSWPGGLRAPAKFGQANALTAELVKADTARDRAVLYLFVTVRAARLSPDEATQKAAAALMPTVSVYSGAPTEAADRETALISGLVVDLKKPGTGPGNQPKQPDPKPKPQPGDDGDPDIHLPEE